LSHTEGTYYAVDVKHWSTPLSTTDHCSSFC